MPRAFIPPQLRDLTQGLTEVEAPGVTVRQVVEALETRYPGIAARLCRDGELSPALQVSIDGTRFLAGADGGMLSILLAAPRSIRRWRTKTVIMFQQLSPWEI